MERTTDRQASAAKHTYDLGYNKWDKFDVDAELEAVDAQNGGSSTRINSSSVAAGEKGSYVDPAEKAEVLKLQQELEKNIERIKKNGFESDSTDAPEEETSAQEEDTSRVEIRNRGPVEIKPVEQEQVEHLLQEEEFDVEAEVQQCEQVQEVLKSLICARGAIGESSDANKALDDLPALVTSWASLITVPSWRAERTGKLMQVSDSLLALLMADDPMSSIENNEEDIPRDLQAEVNSGKEVPELTKAAEVLKAMFSK